MSIRPFICLFIYLCCHVAGLRAQRIAVLSDIHLLAPELLQEGTPKERLMASEAKMTHESDAIMTYVVDTLLRLHPDLVLISGDLTYNGERASHLRLCRHLNRLRKQGIHVWVVPGNHDIRNPYARSFLATRTEDADYITAEDFARLYYADTTPTDHFMQDTLSLSYAVTPFAGLTLLGIDSNRYSENRLVRNGDERNENLTAGRISPQTLKWVCGRAEEARSAGRRVLAFMHHHLVEHFDGESVMLTRYIVPETERVSSVLAAAGVHVVFTGHFHVTDAAQFLPATLDNPTLTITDIGTGSLTTYPFPLRMATLDPNGQLAVQTHFLHPSDSLVDASRRQLENGISTLANMMAERLWNRFGKKMTDLLSMLALFDGEDSSLPADSRQWADFLMKQMRPVLFRCLLAVTQGNEPETDPDLVPALRQAATQTLSALLPTSAKDSAEEIIQNLWPSVEPLVLSMFHDINRVGLQTESRTDDHTPVVNLSLDSSHGKD